MRYPGCAQTYPLSAIKKSNLLNTNHALQFIRHSTFNMADIKPPFNLESAQRKVKFAQDKWNTKNPDDVSLAYTEDSIWRNRDQFLQGRDAIRAFLRKKWEKENHYRLRKELFAYTDNKIAVQFWYEYLDDNNNWKRCYGLEDWTFAEDGKMRKRQMSGNEITITEESRWFKDGVDVNTVEISEKHW